MISYVETKYPGYGFIQKTLEASKEANYWTNFAPVSLRLEAEIESLLQLPDNKTAIVCSNGTQALFGLVNLYAYLRKKPLKWVVSAFTFHCQKQGPLTDSIVIDCDEKGCLDYASLIKYPLDSYDGIIVTNLFGKASDIERYIEFAKTNNKILLFDSATCFYSKYKGRFLGQFGDAEFFSFHHTKPCGFGEGGCVIIDVQYKDIFRSIINFGLYKNIKTRELSMNGKMSDVSAAFILNQLRHVEEIKRNYNEQHVRITSIAKSLSLKLLFEINNESEIPNIVPIIYQNHVPEEKLMNEYITLRKIYVPIAEGFYNATNIYKQIVVFPCHSGISGLTDKQIAAILKNIML